MSASLHRFTIPSRRMGKSFGRCDLCAHWTRGEGVQRGEFGTCAPKAYRTHENDRCGDFSPAQSQGNDNG